MRSDLAERLWELLCNEDHFDQAVEVLRLRPELAVELVDRVRVEFDPREEFIELRPSLKVACALAEHAHLNVHTLTVQASDEGLEGLRHVKGLKDLHVWGPGSFDPSSLRDLVSLECLGAEVRGGPGPSLERLSARVDPSALGTWAGLDWLTLTLTRSPTEYELRLLEGPYSRLALSGDEIELPFLPRARRHRLTGCTVSASALADVTDLAMSEGRILGRRLVLPDRCRRIRLEDVDAPAVWSVSRGTRIEGFRPARLHRR